MCGYASITVWCAVHRACVEPGQRGGVGSFLQVATVVELRLDRVSLVCQVILLAQVLSVLYASVFFS